MSFLRLILEMIENCPQFLVTIVPVISRASNRSAYNICMYMRLSTRLQAHHHNVIHKGSSIRKRRLHAQTACMG